MFNILRPIIGRVRNAFAFAEKHNIYLGRCPRRVPVGSIVFFPLQPATFYCGLAGIITINSETNHNPRIVQTLRTEFQTIQSNNLTALKSGDISAQAYLGGREPLGNLSELIRRFKQDTSLEHLIFQDDAIQSLADLIHDQKTFLRHEETLIEKHAAVFSTETLEAVNAALTILKDCLWALDQDIFSNLERILYLTGSDHPSNLTVEGFKKYREINLLLNSIDRLEVRGRDSAGVQISLSFPGSDALNRLNDALKADGLMDDLNQRSGSGDLLDGSIHVSETTADQTPSCMMTFTYKKASVTGKLGENTAYIRDRIRSDRILRTAVNAAGKSDIYMAHTRWASVGAITVENCHPINNFMRSETTETSDPKCLTVKHYPYYGAGNWTIHAALNGDIDNYHELRSSFESNGVCLIDDHVTTDTKIIPLQIEKYLFEGHDLKESFRLALNDFKGSHAIAVQSILEPGKVFLAIRGSGQSLYIGLCDNQYMFSSELYGLVELTPNFIKMDGESERIKGDASTRGQIYTLSKTNHTKEAGLSACYYDGHPIQISDRLVQHAEITTRDIDRKEYPHFLLKEILEAPLSFKKTLRGKYRISRSKSGTAEVAFNLGNDIVPQRLKDDIAGKHIHRIFLIGQGTACIAGAAIAEAMSLYLKGKNIQIESKTASELSGFSLEERLDHTLIIAVTQSGTTTDTNRAVAMARERGARLLAIVNRRQSDITHVVDGVFYTSDGRDIEMSVASTKAFYSQIAAGYILALYFSQLMKALPDDRIARRLEELQQAPDKMQRVIAIKDRIRKFAWELVKQKTYWATVGSGPNKTAADEIRIKLSELCYKTISSDIVEDKKHIDLSSEPLIIVCAAGTPELVIEDIVKDVAIFKAHASSVVVITDEGETRFDPIADAVIQVPKGIFPVSVIMNTLAGHVWGYYAARSIDEDGNFFRKFRRELSLKTRELDETLPSLYEKISDPDLIRIIEEFSTEFHSRRQRKFFSSMSLDTASDITLLLKYAIGKMPLEDFWEEFKTKRTSPSPLDMLDVCLGRAIDELSRPIDAIRHQAKTVTVGTSRKAKIPKGILFDFLGELNFSLENLSSKNGQDARRIQKAVSEITGYTLYDIDNLDMHGKPQDDTTISISGRSGISLQLTSRVTPNSSLKGTKKSLVSGGAIYAGLGKSDQAPLVIIPLLGSHHTIHHLLLIHVKFQEHLSVTDKIEVLGDKFGRIRDIVNEINLPWNDDYLEKISVECLLDKSIEQIASSIIDSIQTNPQ